MTLELGDAAGIVNWRRRITLKYSRTWREDTGGTSLQVWRFLANGNLRATAVAGPAPCSAPPARPPTRAATASTTA